MHTPYAGCRACASDINVDDILFAPLARADPSVRTMSGPRLEQHLHKNEAPCRFNMSYPSRCQGVARGKILPCARSRDVATSVLSRAAGHVMPFPDMAHIQRGVASHCRYPCDMSMAVSPHFTRQPPAIAAIPPSGLGHLPRTVPAMSSILRPGNRMRSGPEITAPWLCRRAGSYRKAAAGRMGQVMSNLIGSLREAEHQ